MQRNLNIMVNIKAQDRGQINSKWKKEWRDILKMVLQQEDNLTIEI